MIIVFVDVYLCIFCYIWDYLMTYINVLLDCSRGNRICFSFFDCGRKEFTWNITNQLTNMHLAAPHSSCIEQCLIFDSKTMVGSEESLRLWNGVQEDSTVRLLGVAQFRNMF